MALKTWNQASCPFDGQGQPQILTFLEASLSKETIILSTMISDYGEEDAQVTILHLQCDDAPKFKWTVDLPALGSPVVLDSKLAIMPGDKLAVLSSSEDVSVLVSGDESWPLDGEGYQGEALSACALLKLLKTVDGEGSGLDADTLRGLSPEDIGELGGGGGGSIIGGGGGGTQNCVTFTSSGTFTVPEGVEHITCLVCGGGGGGNGAGGGIYPPQPSGQKGGDSRVGNFIVAPGGDGANGTEGGYDSEDPIPLTRGAYPTGTFISVPANIQNFSSIPWDVNPFKNVEVSFNNTLGYGYGGKGWTYGDAGGLNGGPASAGIGCVLVAPGSSIPIVVGAGGAGGAGSFKTGGNGGAGVVKIYY